MIEPNEDMKLLGMEEQEGEFETEDGRLVKFTTVVAVIELGGVECEFVAKRDFKGVVKREFNKLK